MLWQVYHTGMKDDNLLH